jgi:Fe-S-cluster-containing dehydrogenase component/DMSO reductase anchor subunit
MRRLAFAIDLDRCTGCGACALGCQIANGLKPGTSWRRVATFNWQRLPQAPVVHLSLGCFHCDDPACATGCPAAALRRDPSTGTVQLDAHRCLGCRYCTWLCPFAAPRFDSSEGRVAKCTLCVERVREGGDPACVTACPTGALTVVERVAVEERGSDAWAPGVPGRELGPAVVVRHDLRSAPPRYAPSPPTTAPATHVPVRSWRLVADEWALIAFSLLVVASVGWSFGPVLGGPGPSPAWLIVLGAAAAGVAAAHLGQPARAWRAASNLRRSWVSREVVLYGAFLVTALLSMVGVLGGVGPMLVAGLGAAAVVSVDMVYRVRQQEHPVVPHSGMASLTAVLIGGVVADLGWLVAGTVLLKAGLYVWRSWRFRDLGARALLRLAVLAAGPVLLLSGAPVLGWLLLGIGELIDRAELYAELRFLDPTLQIRRDLERSVAPYGSTST